jgi:hypothetical protein
MVFSRATVQEETHVKRDGPDVDHKIDQNKIAVPVAAVDRRWRCQEDTAQSSAVLVPAAGTSVQVMLVLSPSRV